MSQKLLREYVSRVQTLVVFGLPTYPFSFSQEGHTDTRTRTYRCECMKVQIGMGPGATHLRTPTWKREEESGQDRLFGGVRRRRDEDPDLGIPSSVDR